MKRPQANILLLTTTVAQHGINFQSNAKHSTYGKCYVTVDTCFFIKEFDNLFSYKKYSFINVKYFSPINSSTWILNKNNKWISKPLRYFFHFKDIFGDIMAPNPFISDPGYPPKGHKVTTTHHNWLKKVVQSENTLRFLIYERGLLKVKSSKTQLPKWATALCRTLQWELKSPYLHTG